MANNVKCKDCSFYHEQRKPLRKGGTKSLQRGHCLAQTVYASNRPDNPVFPPNAKTAELPYGRHQITAVMEDELRPHCPHVKRR